MTPELSPGRLVLWALLPFFAAWAVYSPVLDYDYVQWDDPGYVSKNIHVLEGISLSNALWGLTTGEQANWHPLTWWSLQLDSTLLGPKPESYHFTNILLHAIASGLYFMIAARLFRDIRLALVVSLLWAVHPLHVESVAWISERKDVLSTLFWLLATWCYLQYVEKPSLLRMMGVTLLLALGLAAKPMLVTFPFTLLLLDYAPLHRLGSRREWIRAVVEKIPLFLLVTISSSVTLYVQAKGNAVSNLNQRSIFQRVEGASVGYGFYLKKTFLPVDLLPIYEHPRDRFYWQMALSLILIAGITWGAYQLRKSAPLVLVGWLFFLGTLVPVIGLIQVGSQAYADRYSYVPHLGLFLALVSAVAVAFDRWKQDRKGIVIGGIVLTLVAAFLTQGQCKLWKSHEALWEGALEHDPFSARNHYNLITFNVNARNLPKALEHAEKAVEYSPEDSTYRIYHLQILHALDRKEEVKRGIPEIRSRFEVNSKDEAILRYLEAMMAEEEKRWDDAIRLYREAIELSPYEFVYFKSLGLLLHQVGRNDEACQALEGALHEKPDAMDLACKVADISLELGKASDAIELLKTAIYQFHFYEELRPKTKENDGKAARLQEAKARDLLAASLLAAGRSEEAIEEAKEVNRLDPAFAESRVLVCLNAVAHPDSKFRQSKRPRYAIELALLLVAPERPPMLLDVQAVVSASQGDFPRAIALAEEALRTAPPALKKGIEERLKLFQDHKPYLLSK